MRKSPFCSASRSHFWPSQSEKKFSWANYGWAKFLAGPLLAQPMWKKNLAGPIDDPAINPAIILVQQNWPSQNMAQALGPAKTGRAAKLWLSQKVEKFGPAVMWKKENFGWTNFDCWPSFGLYPNTIKVRKFT